MRKFQNKAKINFTEPTDIIYWAKKWEISPHQLFVAHLKTKSNFVWDIKAWLRHSGFAL